MAHYTIYKVAMCSGGYKGVARVSAEILSENCALAPNLFTIHVGDKITKSYTVYYIATFSTSKLHIFAFEITEFAITEFKRVKCL